MKSGWTVFAAACAVVLVSDLACAVSSSRPERQSELKATTRPAGGEKGSEAIVSGAKFGRAAVGVCWTGSVWGGLSNSVRATLSLENIAHGAFCPDDLTTTGSGWSLGFH